MGVDAAIQEEASRVQKVYASRKDSQLERNYDPLTPSGLWSQIEVDRHLLWGLGQQFESLEVLRQVQVLEVGCGSGGHLLRLLSLGIPPAQLHGIDLLSDRVEVARSLHDGVDFRLGNAVELPWADGSMDIVLQLTCLSSVLDAKVQGAIAKEMVRVLRPGGAIISFDFVWNPINRNTIGITRSKLKALFPNARISSRRVFLAPPVARKLLPRFRLFATLLDMIPWLCFHRIAIIRPSS